jgi:hypothetical protein
MAAFVWLALFLTTEKGNDDGAFAMVSYGRETACEKDCFSRSGSTKANPTPRQALSRFTGSR